MATNPDIAYLRDKLDRIHDNMATKDDVKKIENVVSEVQKKSTSNCIEITTLKTKMSTIGLVIFSIGVPVALLIIKTLMEIMWH